MAGPARSSRLGSPAGRPDHRAVVDRGDEATAAPPAADRRGTVVPAVLRTRRGLRPRLPRRDRRCATATSGSSTARRSGRPMATSPSCGLLLARTDPDLAKHQGITYFAVDMHASGVEIRPLRADRPGEHEFNEVFLTDVRIPDLLRISPVGDGWGAAQTTLQAERFALSGARRSGGPVTRSWAARPSTTCWRWRHGHWPIRRAALRDVRRDRTVERAGSLTGPGPHLSGPDAGRGRPEVPSARSPRSPRRRPTRRCSWWPSTSWRGRSRPWDGRRHPVEPPASCAACCDPRQLHRGRDVGDPAQHRRRAGPRIAPGTRSVEGRGLERGAPLLTAGEPVAVATAPASSGAPRGR